MAEVRKKAFLHIKNEQNPGTILDYSSNTEDNDSMFESEDVMEGIMLLKMMEVN